MKQGKVDIITLGCSKNLVDSEQLMKQLQLSGYVVEHDSPNPNGEIVVVNTCGFIGDAKEESVNMILSLVEAKKRRKIGQLYVMGCLSGRYIKELPMEIPEVDRYYGKFNWKELLSDLNKSYNTAHRLDRIQTTPQHYAYVKIAEGCNRTCAYCAIPIITGKYQSRPLEEIVDEVTLLASGGVKEIQLIAQDLTYYGWDIYRQYRLPELVEKLSEIEGIEWIRLHYGYPTRFPLDLLRVIRERDNVCKYLDLALQHISDPMLTRMRRKITKKQTLDLIETIRKEVPGISLRTTLMVGFPGETEQDFNELLAFVKEARFERLGTFTYSEEEDTYSATHYEDNIPQELKSERQSRVMEIQEKIAEQWSASKVGKTLKVIIDREDDEYYVGRTEFDSPEVDMEVLIDKKSNLAIGEFYCATITDSSAFDLFADIVT